VASSVFVGFLVAALLAGLWAQVGARPARSGDWLMVCAALFAAGIVVAVALTPGAL
jgi:hypothetical protein